MRPSIGSASDGIRIRHREYFWTTVGGLGSVFGVWKPIGASPPRINPANDFLFPWLSNIAVCYERYTFNKLTFGYMPKCSTATSGTVIMAIEPDPLDLPPATEGIMLSYKSAVDGPPWAELKTTLSTADLHGSQIKKYVTRVPDAEPRSSDCGYFLFWADGLTQTGKFYVDYDITLYTPQLPATGTTSVGVAADVIPTSTEMFGIAPEIVSKGIRLVKSAIANRFEYEGLNIGDIVDIVWNYTSASSVNVSMSDVWPGVAGLAQLQSATAITVLPSNTGSMTKQFQVTNGTGFVTFPQPGTQNAPPSHSNTIWVTGPQAW